MTVVASSTGKSDVPPAVVVTFRLPSAVGAESACVVGEFNDWSHTATPMERDGDGFVAHAHIPPGRAYRFRYLLDGERWENDWAADDYVPNEFGGDDSVIDLTSGGGSTPVDHAPPPVKATTKRTRSRAPKVNTT